MTETITDRIRNGEFVNHVEYPSRPAWPRLVSNPTAAQARKFADEVELYETLEKNFHDRSRAYSRGEQEAMARFKLAVLEELGLVGHPKAERLYAMAWDHGHSSGLSDVWYWAEELAELVN